MEIFTRDKYHLLVSYLKRWGSQKGRNSRGEHGAKTKTNSKKKNWPDVTTFGSYYDCRPILPLIHHSFAPTYTHTYI